MLAQIITIRSIVLSIILTAILAVANTYLALKIGFLTSASIPAALLSMSILRFFKNSTIYENNLVQTAASAGEAVAGGIVYTVPGLIIIQYWQHFSYFQCFIMALIGGFAGIFFSVPLRRMLVTAKDLPFPEATAIAGVLQANIGGAKQLRAMVWGSLAGATLDFLQNGVKLIASHYQKIKIIGHSLLNLEMGFSAALIAAGYLMGFVNGLSLFAGAIIAWGICAPVLSALGTMAAADTAEKFAGCANAVHYIGIGAMLTAALFAVVMLIIPVLESLKRAWKTRYMARPSTPSLMEHRDLPYKLVIPGIVILILMTLLYYGQQFNLPSLGLSQTTAGVFTATCLLFTFLMGFVAVVICSYFSGLVGVSATPGSSIIIGSVLLATFTLQLFFPLGSLSADQLNTLAAIIIIIGSVITAAACIANDNSQDLKVGYIIGAKPWQQQVMLMLGVLIAAIIIPPVMDLLFYSYGIANILPRPGMDPALTLAAPPAAAIVGTVQSVLGNNLPWKFLSLGALIICACIPVQMILRRYKLRFSVIGIAIGIYLPLTSTVPLFLGACTAFLAGKAIVKERSQNHNGTLLACGLITGAALMDVGLAFWVSMGAGPSFFHGVTAPGLALGLAIVSSLGLCGWFYSISRQT